MPRLFLVDGNAYLHRSYHAVPPLSTSRGEPVNALYGFTRFLLKLLRAHAPDFCAVCFDSAGPTFRHVAYPDYKATRKKTDDDLLSQMPRAREAVTALSLAVIEKSGFEADDLIATLARAAARDGAEVVIVTGDKDACQLVDAHITVYNESKDAFIDAAGVCARFGVPPERLADLLALMGDASDNVPGVPGVGERTAAKLLAEHGSLDRILERAEELPGKVGAAVRAGRESALRSRELVILRENVPLDRSWRDCSVRPPDRDVLRAFLARYEFNGLLRELDLPAAAPKEDFFHLLS